MKSIITSLLILILSTALYSQTTITTDSILQLSTCAGGNVLVKYHTTGTFALGCKFTAQLSDMWGQFTNPINIGSVPYNVGYILAKIPQNTNFGIFYKIRVISSSPADTGTACPNTLIVTQIAQLNQITASPNDTICEGDTATLNALNIATEYKWSTGDTTQTIKVSKAGVYSVTTTDYTKCTSDTSISIVTKKCPTGINKHILNAPIVIYPNPASNIIYIKNHVLTSNSSFKCINSLGEVVKSGALTSNQLNIADLPIGLYVLQIASNTDYNCVEFLKNK